MFRTAIIWLLVGLLAGSVIGCRKKCKKCQGGGGAPSGGGPSGGGGGSPGGPHDGEQGPGGRPLAEDGDSIPFIDDAGDGSGIDAGNPLEGDGPTPTPIPVPTETPEPLTPAPFSRCSPEDPDVKKSALLMALVQGDFARAVDFVKLAVAAKADEPSNPLPLELVKGPTGTHRVSALGCAMQTAGRLLRAKPDDVATQRQLKAFVDKLLGKDVGADPNQADVDGNTPLHLAAYYGLPEMAELLLKHAGPPRVDPNARNGVGGAERTPLGAGIAGIAKSERTFPSGDKVSAPSERHLRTLERLLGVTRMFEDDGTLQIAVDPTPNNALRVDPNKPHERIPKPGQRGTVDGPPPLKAVNAMLIELTATSEKLPPLNHPLYQLEQMLKGAGAK